jgi:phage terminase small subunit
MALHRAPTAKQARFIAEYLRDLNAAGAAIRAGYGVRSARHTASRLLQKPHVRAEVLRLQAEQLEHAQVTAQGVLEQLRRIAFFDARAVYDERGSLKHPTEWPDSARAALASFDVTARGATAEGVAVERVTKIRLESKLQALELLAKHLGLLTERQQVDTHLTITWLPPEPPSPLPTVETIDAMGPPRALDVDEKRPHVCEREMGFSSAARGSLDRTPTSKDSESPGEPSSSAVRETELQRSIRESGLGERALLRMFPEMREQKVRP